MRYLSSPTQPEDKAHHQAEPPKAAPLTKLTGVSLRSRLIERVVAWVARSCFVSGPSQRRCHQGEEQGNSDQAARAEDAKCCEGADPEGGGYGNVKRAYACTAWP